MDDNQIEGAALEGVGRLQDTWGAATADPEAQIQGKIKQLRGATQRLYGDAREDLTKTLDDGLAQVNALIQDTIELVTRKPLTAMGMAVVVGLTLGLMGRSRGQRIVYVRR